MRFALTMSVYLMTYEVFDEDIESSSVLSALHMEMKRL